MTWIKQILQGLFPGDQLTTLLEMIGVFVIIVLYGATRAKFWQDRGGSAIFLTKQRFQTLFGKEKHTNEAREQMSQNFLGCYPFVRRAAFALVAYFCFHAAVLESRASRRYQEAAKWPVTQAIIDSSKVYWTNYSWSRNHNRYCPQLIYKYTIKGRDYAGYNRVFDFPCWPDAYDFVAKHQPGSIVTIAYDPTDVSSSFIPSSVRDPGWPWGDVIGGIFFAALLAADLFVAWTRQSEPQTT